MKTKIISVISLLAIVASLLSSCGGTETVYYGTVETDSYTNTVCINIPTVGLCRIPEAKSVVSEISGKRVKDYTLKEGDLVRLTFKSSEEIAIMETHPAGFSIACEEIVAFAEGISLEYEAYPGRNPVCRITCNATGALAGANASDYVAFCLGKSTDITKAYCYAEVYAIRDNGKITLEIELPEGVTASELLSKFPDEFNFIVY